MKMRININLNKTTNYSNHSTKSIRIKEHRTQNPKKTQEPKNPRKTRDSGPWVVDGKARRIAREPMIPDGGGRTLRHMRTHNPLIKRQFSKIMFLRGL